MSISALLLIVLAAFIHAGWNLIAKNAARGATFVWLYCFVIVLVYGPVAIGILIYENFIPNLAQWAFIVASAILHLGYSLALQKGYQVADLSVVYPLARGTGPLISTLGAIVFLGERPSPLALLGALGIVVGVMLMAGGTRIFQSKNDKVTSGLKWGALTGAFIAAYTLVDAYTVKVLLFSPIVLDVFSSACRLFVLTPGVMKHRSDLKDTWRLTRWHALAVGILSPLSYIIVLFVMRMAPVSHVAPARELSMMVGTLFGVFILKEPHGYARIAGASLIAAGVMGLLWG